MLERVWRKGTLLHCWWECKLVQPLWRTVWRFLKKQEIELPYNPAIPLLSIHSEETRIERDSCTPMFIAALFTIARTWKQCRCPSADKWIRKLWYIYTMEYYSAIKKNTFESVLMRWLKLEPIIQSEVSQKEKHIQYINTYIWNLERWEWWPYMRDRKRDTDVKNRIWGPVGEGKDRMIWENSIETCVLPYVKQITSSGSMHETGCSGWVSGMTLKDGMGRE